MIVIVNTSVSFALTVTPIGIAIEVGPVLLNVKVLLTTLVVPLRMLILAVAQFAATSTMFPDIVIVLQSPPVVNVPTVVSKLLPLLVALGKVKTTAVGTVPPFLFKSKMQPFTLVYVGKALALQ